MAILGLNGMTVTWEVFKFRWNKIAIFSLKPFLWGNMRSAGGDGSAPLAWLLSHGDANNIRSMLQRAVVAHHDGPG